MENLEERTDAHNPQLILIKYKEIVAHEARSRQKCAVSMRQTLADDAKEEQTKIYNDPNLNKITRKLEGGILDDKRRDLENQMHDSARVMMKLWNMKQGEKIGMYWSSLNKASKPREHLVRLKIPGLNLPRYTQRSDKMAEIGRRHHENLLKAGIHLNKEEREQEIWEVLKVVKDESKLPSPAKDDLDSSIDEEGVKVALKESANGAAPGLDGIIYEYWKFLQGVKEEDKKRKEPKYQGLNIMKSLTMVYKDIEIYGVDKNSRFTEGWMCLIYKKGERELIENYRPITLLNLDYKILTKEKAIQLAKAAPSCIHKNQAGFMPGRDIHCYDPTS